MQNKMLWKFAKVLEGIGLVVVLVGVLWSIDLGMKEEGLSSMSIEFNGLMIGGGLFVVGYLLERAAGRS